MYTVVCFGDTNTWGYDNRSGDRLPYDERWTGMLAKELGADFRVIEEGLPGRATTEDPVESGKNARAQIGPCLESHAPIDVFVMMLGQPDLKKRFSLTACDISMGIEALSRMVLSSNKWGRLQAHLWKTGFLRRGRENGAHSFRSFIKGLRKNTAQRFWRHRPWQQQRRMPSILTTALMQPLRWQWRTK
mgnify:CR=1 FL=1